MGHVLLCPINNSRNISLSLEVTMCALSAAAASIAMDRDY